MHILMADDDKDDFILLQEAAQKLGTPIEITYAPNWMEIWRQLMKQAPDVIFLDLNMPVKDGFECLDSLRQERKYKKIPIIIYSTSTSKTDIDKAYSTGANYFIVKPNTMDEIARVLERVKGMTKEELSHVPPREHFLII